MNYEVLPEGWTATTLRDLIDGFETGRNLRAHGHPAASGQCGVLKISAVTWGAFRPEENKALLPGDIPRPHERISKGDLLITRANTSDLVGAVVLVDRAFPELMLPDKILRIRPVTSVVDPRYLLHALRSKEVREHFGQNATGTSDSMRNLSQPKIAAAPIALPPLAEQRRIVEKVEALLARVNASRDRLAKVPAILKRFRQSVVDAACSGRLTSHTEPDGEIPADWSWRGIDELIVRGGLFDGARDHGSATPVEANLRTSDYTDHGVRVVRLENLGHLHFIDSKRTYISERKHIGLKQSTVVSGDVLVGSFIDEAVRVCELLELDTPAIAKADCFCIRAQQEDVLPRYLALQIGCSRTYRALLEEVHGATRPRISTKQLRALQVPICSVPEQREIIRRVGALFELADAIERRVAFATVRADKLTQAILAKAFRGELVPTEADLARQEGREYEQASVLLERVRAERTATTNLGDRKRPRTGRRRSDAA